MSSSDSFHRPFATRPASSFDVRVSRGLRTIACAGAFDLAALALFGDAAAELLDDGPESASVDLTEVRFLDAAGLGALIMLRNELRPFGSDLRLVGACAVVRRVLRFAALDTATTAAGGEVSP